MIETRRAEVRTENGHQVIVLPDDIHFEEDEVSLVHNRSTGEITMQTGQPEKTWQDFIDFLDALNIPQEDIDTWMVDRPMNVPLPPEDIFGDDE